MRRYMTVTALVLPVLLAALAGGPARAERFLVSPGDPNLVKFESKAPMESFEGKTKQVTGQIVFNPARLADSLTVHMEVDLASLDTGISMRNKHMREDHLETATYPKAIFHGTKLLDPSAPALAPGQKVSFTLEGEFSLHGVTKTIQVPVEVTSSVKDDVTRIHVVTHFLVKLSDYKIDRPQFLVMRLDENQKVTVDVMADLK